MEAFRRELADAPAPEWSVVVITRDEERHIAACLDAVSAAMRGRSHEIIVVDSSSTDRTLEIAARYAATLLRLRGGAPLTPAAGRHAGFVRSRGTFVLFLDGDSVLDPGWVEPARRALDDDRIAGVAGIREAVLRPAANAPEQRWAFPQDVAPPAEPGFLGGSAVYRASVLRAVGGYNPFMFACEEAELGARLRACGHRLRRLPIRMTEHLVETPTATLRELRRRVRRGYPYGMGQLVRHGLANRSPVPDHVTAVARPLLVTAFGLAVLPAALAAAFGRPAFLAVWLSLAVLALAAFSVRAGGVRKPLYYAIEWALTGVMIARGLLMRPRPATDYPTSAIEVVREARGGR